jgi:hypothetical protein
MEEMDESEVIAQARVVYHRLQDETLARSALGDIAAWVSSGIAPDAESLRSRGLAGPAGAGAANISDLGLARKAFIRDWGFAIPCAEAVSALRRLGPIVEVGAGTGYWTALLRAAGHDMIATDLAAGASKHGFSVGRHAEVEQLAASQAVLRYPDRDLFCSWPSENEPWAAEAVLAVKAGRRIALILDDRGTMTGDAALRDALEAGCRSLATVQIPQFPNVQDRLHIYERLAR